MQNDKPKHERMLPAARDLQSQRSASLSKPRASAFPCQSPPGSATCEAPCDCLPLATSRPHGRTGRRPRAPLARRGRHASPVDLPRMKSLANSSRRLVLLVALAVSYGAGSPAQAADNVPPRASGRYSTVVTWPAGRDCPRGICKIRLSAPRRPPPIWPRPRPRPTKTCGPLEGRGWRAQIRWQRTQLVHRQGLRRLRNALRLEDPARRG